MKLNLLYVCALLCLALVRSRAVTPEVYWKSVLPNSPMPKSIKDLLYTGARKVEGEVPTAYKASLLALAAKVVFKYDYKISDTQVKDDPNVALFFLEKDLHQGTKMNLHFIKTDQNSTFLPRKIADSIPFSSTKLPQIYNKLSVKPDSLEAKIIKKTLSECEDTSIQGEEKYCATSLESMVDFSTTKLGENVRAISTEVNNKESTPLQNYKIELTKKLAANKAVVCHKQNYAYAVFYCHKTVNVEAYAISMIGEDGTKVNAVAVCHTDTEKWNPKHLAFQVLKVKPGTVPICHFLPEDHIVWVPY